MEFSFLSMSRLPLCWVQWKVLNGEEWRGISGAIAENHNAPILLSCFIAINDRVSWVMNNSLNLSWMVLKVMIMRTLVTWAHPLFQQREPFNPNFSELPNLIIWSHWRKMQIHLQDIYNCHTVDLLCTTLNTPRTLAPFYSGFFGSSMFLWNLPTRREGDKAWWYDYLSVTNFP